MIASSETTMVKRPKGNGSQPPIEVSPSGRTFRPIQMANSATCRNRNGRLPLNAEIQSAIRITVVR